MSDQDYLNSLLEAATTGTRQPKALSIHAREIEAYIAFKDVREGPNNVPLDAIYSDYRGWSNEPLSLPYFKKYFNKHFKQYKRHGHFYYKVEADSFGLPDFYTISRDPNYLKHKTTKQHPMLLGVWKHNRNEWFARLLLPTGKYLPLGTYYTAFEAAHTYDEAALLVYGKDAVLNFPRKWRTIRNGQKEVPLIHRHKVNQKFYNNSVKQGKKETLKYQERLEALRRQADYPEE
jgi:hypothetical protein